MLLDLERGGCLPGRFMMSSRAHHIWKLQGECVLALIGQDIILLTYS